MPAFGFSVSDFIGAIQLIAKVSQALRDSGGASAEYQAVLSDLKALELILRQLQSLESASDSVSHVNAVRCQAQVSQQTLLDFLERISKFQSGLASDAARKAYRGVGRKVQWTLLYSKEVEKLRRVVATQLVSLKLLLDTMNMYDACILFVSEMLTVTESLLLPCGHRMEHYYPKSRRRTLERFRQRGMSPVALDDSATSWLHVAISNRTASSRWKASYSQRRTLSFLTRSAAK